MTLRETTQTLQDADRRARELRAEGFRVGVAAGRTYDADGKPTVFHITARKAPAVRICQRCGTTIRSEYFGNLCRNVAACDRRAAARDGEARS